MKRSRVGKDGGGGGPSKGQAVLSRFFAPLAADRGADQCPRSSSPRVASPTTVVWPPAGRSSEKSKSRYVEDVASEAGKRRLSGIGSEQEQDASSSHKRAKPSETQAVGESIEGKDQPESALGFPGLDPARHKKFLDAFLARSDKEAGQSGYYGKPPSGNDKYTPLEQQVVELKAKYPDVLLMVEVGYKFRFFGSDAETAAKVLGIIAHYDHNFLTASIPTFRLHVHVRRLVEAGCKVGVVKQTETAAIKAQSNKAGPFTRGLSALYTKATLEAGEYLGGDEESGEQRLSNYIMCIVEEPVVDKDANKELINFDARFGLVAVDVVTGDIMHGCFMDSVTRTELESRLLSCAPAELLLTSSLSSATEKLLLDYAGPASDARVERVYQDSYGSGGAAAAIADFYGHSSTHVKTGSKANAGLEALMAMPELVVSAFGHILCYLKQFELQTILLVTESFRPFGGQREMILSPNTLRQLEILKNNMDNTEQGSLLWLMNHTRTSFGARMLRYWITRPSRDYAVITMRLDAVEELSKAIGSSKVQQADGSFPGSGKGGGALGAVNRGRLESEGPIASALSSLSKIPDLERGITRIYHRTATTSEFITTIQAILTAASQLQRIGTGNNSQSSVQSSLLRRLVAAATSTSVVEHANRLVASLNAIAAGAGDKINLFVHGRFPEVDKCREIIRNVEEELEGMLPNYRRLLKIPSLEYLSVSGASFLLEVPCALRVPSDWLKINSTKKVNRYHPPEVLEATDRLALAKEELNVACSRAWDIFLSDFSCHYSDFRAAVHALAALDCLNSLAVVSCNQGYVRPEFVGDQEQCCLTVKDGRHAVLDMTLQSAFVPNDTVLSEDGEICQIITGPNMGGKSCYIRQVALIAIMAQMGSYVPATSARLHVFDSIYTRMGASDSIQRGSSTFFEELSEASAILNTATKHSLVIIDELGRGTSTHDGVAIAYASLQYLLQKIKCFTLFVTHYPKISELVDVFSGQVRAYHVSYLADSEESDLSKQYSDVDPQKVTFLYKLQPGVASRSFGMHVARLAMVPDPCVAKAVSVAANFENVVKCRADKHANELLIMLQQICSSDDLETLKDARRVLRSSPSLIEA